METTTNAREKGICPQCGEHNDSNARFCSNCGKKLSDIQGLSVMDYDSDKAKKKKYIIYIFGAIAIILICSGLWQFNRSSVNSEKDKVTNSVDSIASDVSSTKNSVTVEDALHYILSKTIGVEENRTDDDYVRMYFTKEYRTIYKKACEIADREGGEYPRLWWSYSDSDPESFKIDDISITSNNEAKAYVTLTSELYIGKLIVILKNEDDKWLIHKVDEKEIKNNPNFDVGNDYSNSVEQSYQNKNTTPSSKTFANEQYVTMYLANQTFTNGSGVDIRIDGSLRMYIDGDYAGVVSVLRYNSTSAMLRYGGGAYGEGKIGVSIENGRLKLNDPADGTTWYQK